VPDLLASVSEKISRGGSKVTDKEKEVLQDALHGEAGYGFSDERNHIELKD